MLQETETPKKFLIFSYVLGKGEPENFFYISGGKLQSLKIKNILYFSKSKYFFIIIIQRFFIICNDEKLKARRRKIIKDIRNLFRLEKEVKGIKYILLRNIKNLFEHEKEK